MAWFTANGSLRLLLHGERTCLGSEPKDPIRFRLSEGRRSSRNSVGLQSRGRNFGHRGLGGVSAVGKKAGGSKSGERLKREDFDDIENGEDEDEAEEELVRDEFSCFRGLVLDISYRPVNVVCWKRAICLEFMEKAVKRRRIKHNLNRKSIFYRDSYTCQYCSSHESLTIDHVLPISRGGEWKWENLVAACARCNSRKGQKTLEEANMKLIKIPKVPKDYDILSIPLTSAAVRMLKTRKGVPHEWKQYLPS